MWIKTNQNAILNFPHQTIDSINANLNSVIILVKIITHSKCLVGWKIVKK